MIVAIGLLTNVFFTYYPNVFNMSGDIWDQQLPYYRAYYNFKNDANFVGHWTLPGQSVALISSFATKILLQSNRRPFFNDSLAMMDQPDLLRLANQLDQGNPRMVFIEKKILNITGNPAFDQLMEYLKAHYQYTGNQSDGLILLRLVGSVQ